DVEYFRVQFHKYKASKTYLFGFSFGAVIALLASTQMPIDGQILCSLSPFFEEDLPDMKHSWKVLIGKRRREDFAQLNAARLAQQVTAPTILLYGSREDNSIESRAQQTYTQLKAKKQLYIVEGAKHDIGYPKYLEQIRMAIHEQLR